MIDFYREARNLIAQEKFDQLNTLSVDKPEYFNWVVDVFEGMNLKDYGESEALIWVSNVGEQKQEKRYTFRQISEESNQFLNFVRAHGVTQSNYMYTQIPLLPANWIGYLAAIKGGMVLIPAATTLAVRDIIYRFETLLPQLVIADLENAQKIEEAEQELLKKDGSKKITLKIILDGDLEGWHSIEEIYDQSTSAEAATTKADDPLFLFFTSGTTGMPKVVTHTHLTYPLGHLSTASWVGVRPGDVHYNISQPGWAKFAWSSFFAPWVMGATIFANYVSKFVPTEQLEAVANYGISTFCAPPTVLRMLIQQDLSIYDFKLRQCVAAGEPLNPDVIEKWKQGTGTLIRDGYGQTETTALVANVPGAEVKYGSMGKPTFMYDIRIANDDGNELPPLEEGHICVVNPEGNVNGIFKEYMGDEERKQKVFKHGLYYTGDKAYKDKEGYIWFVGRDDDVIKASDYRVGPFEVESVLIEHEAVIESAVVASPHELRGAAVKAFVVLKEGVAPSEHLAKELFEFSGKNLATYKIPRIIEFVDEFPKTISGKIRRVELRANEAMNKMKQVKGSQEYFHEKY
ncbi:branched-chain amino acid aminotransferase [marine bacterium AO1-C]|nr:branched-chain amino acid aminotransferase [marine bacterium AO1-C]